MFENVILSGKAIMDKDGITIKIDGLDVYIQNNRILYVRDLLDTYTKHYLISDSYGRLIDPNYPRD